MLLTIFGVFFVLAIVCFAKDIKRRREDRCYDFDGDGAFCMFGIICTIIAGALLLFICIYAYLNIPDEFIIDQKIAMYEEENARIEATIEDMVSGYMEYESGVIDKVINNGDNEENAVALVSLFPELKSDMLVQKQLDLFFYNNEMLKGLRAKKSDLAMIRWSIYFGN